MNPFNFHSGSIRNAQEDFMSFLGETTKLGEGLVKLTRAANGLGVALAATDIIQYADSWQLVENQLLQVTSSSSELSDVQGRLVEVANSTRTEYQATAELYSHLARSTSDMGLSQKELIDLTATINQSFITSGATANEAANAIELLAGGFAAGALSGYDFNAIAMQAPVLVDAIASALNVTTDKLHSMAAGGTLSSEIIVSALQNASDSIENDFSSTVATFGQNLTIAQNNLIEFVGQSGLIDTFVAELGGGLVTASEWLTGFGELAGIAQDSFEIAFSSIGDLGIVTSSSLIESFNSFSELATTSVQSWEFAFRESIGIAGEQGISTAESLVRAWTIGFVNIVTASKQMGVGIGEVLDKVKLEVDRFRAKDAEFTYKFLSGLGLRNSEWAQAQRKVYEELSGGALEYATNLAAIEDAAEKARAQIQENANATFSQLDSQRESLRLNREGVDAVKEGLLILKPELLESEERIELFNIKLGEFNDSSVQIPFRMGEVASATDIATSSMSELGKISQAVSADVAAQWTSTGEEIAKQYKGITGAISNSLVNLIVDGEFSTDGIQSAAEKLIKTKVGDFVEPGIMGILNASGITGFAEGLFGFGQGASSFVGPMTQSAQMGANFGAFMTSPVGIAIMAGIAGKAIHDATNDPDGFHRAMGGFLGAPTPGAPAGSQFSVNSFASGFTPIGFADGPTSIADANKVIDEFRFYDQAVVELVHRLGGTIDLSRATLGGFNVDGTGTGTFFGRTQRTSDAEFQLQMDSFATQLANHIAGLTPDAMAKIAGATTAEELVSVLNALVESNASVIESNENFKLNLEGDLESIVTGPEKPDRKKVEAAIAVARAGMNERHRNSLDRIISKPGDPGTHYANGVLIQGGITWREKIRRDSAEHNKRMVARGYDFRTGTWGTPPGLQAPEMPTIENKVSALGLTPAQETNQLLLSVVNETRETRKILKKFDGDGLPEERT